MSKTSTVPTTTLTEVIELLVSHRYYHMGKLRSSTGLINKGLDNERTRKQYANSFKQVERIDKVLKEIKL